MTWFHGLTALVWTFPPQIQILKLALGRTCWPIRGQGRGFVQENLVRCRRGNLSIVLTLHDEHANIPTHTQCTCVICKKKKKLQQLPEAFCWICILICAQLMTHADTCSHKYAPSYAFVLLCPSVYHLTLTADGVCVVITCVHTCHPNLLEFTCPISLGNGRKVWLLRARCTGSVALGFSWRLLLGRFLDGNSRSEGRVPA